MKKMSVGLTGSLASGKSLVAKLIETIGYPVFNADNEGRKLLEIPQIVENLASYFGHEILVESKIDRKKLGEIVFNNKTKLNYLNSIIHPAIIESYIQWKKIQKSNLVFHESALIFEHHLEFLFDSIICVEALEELCIQRALLRDHLTLAEIKNRLKNQISTEEKCKKADFIIINDNNTAIIPQVLSIIKKLSQQE